MSIVLPPELEVVEYRARYADLAEKDETQLVEHYEIIGRKSGMIGTEAALREEFVKLIGAEDRVLEIGPFCNPLVAGEGVKYLDVLDKTGLEERARQIGYPHRTAPQIHYVSENGSLDVVTELFDAVVSAHCIEHQPDLIRHFKQVGAVLPDGGRYYLIVPDHRYCFDRAMSESNVASLIEAHYEDRKLHAPRSIIEHLALTTHNDPVRHWNGDHFDGDYNERIPTRIRHALDVVDRVKGVYFDVHAWQFSCDTFRTIVTHLYDAAFIDLRPERVYATPFGRFEFTAVLQKRSERL